ncbi:MAG: hypothetical protein ABJK20_02890 [Halieaceae bacterium]
MVLLKKAADYSSTDLRIYIDGDGQPWHADRPAENPTGSGKLTLNLMLADPQASIFLARPCYYLQEMPANCSPDLWTSARYSQRIVSAMTEAVSKLQEEQALKTITLIGYSGGGTLALLVAARLEIPTTVITVAANLDTAAWTAFHGVLPLTESINPAEQHFAVNNIEQHHLLAGADTVVPPATIAKFRRNNPQAEFRLFEKFDHRCCWLENWPAILADY